jgi:hypothetical protein
LEINYDVEDVEKVKSQLSEYRKDEDTFTREEEGEEIEVCKLAVGMLSYEGPGGELYQEVTDLEPDKKPESEEDSGDNSEDILKEVFANEDPANLRYGVTD